MNYRIGHILEMKPTVAGVASQTLCYWLKAAELMSDYWKQINPLKSQGGITDYVNLMAKYSGDTA